MTRATVLLPCLALAAALSGCAGVQKIPVSTDPPGAVVYLDGNQVCAATPCSVEMRQDQSHLVTIVKEGYRQKDVQVRLVQASGGGKTLSPDILTLRLRTPDQPDISDRDSALGTAMDLGTEVLQRLLENARKDMDTGK